MNTNEMSFTTYSWEYLLLTVAVLPSAVFKTALRLFTHGSMSATVYPL